MKFNPLKSLSLKSINEQFLKLERSIGQGGGSSYLSYDSVDDFPAEGEDGVFYIAEDTNLIYRWGGSSYIRIPTSSGVVTKVYNNPNPSVPEFCIYGDFIYVGFSDSVIVKIRISDNSIIWFSTAGSGVRGIATNGTYVYVTNADDNSCSILNCSDGSLFDTISSLGVPWGVYFDGTYLWIMNLGNGTVGKYDATGNLIHTATGLTNPYNAVSDGTLLWVTDSSGFVFTINIISGDVVNSYAIGANPEGIIFDGNNIWVLNWTDNTMMKLNLLGDIVQTVSTGLFHPSVITSDNENLYVSNELKTYISKYRISDGAFLGYFDFGGYFTVAEQIHAVLFDGVNLWVGGNKGDVFKKYL